VLHTRPSAGASLGERSRCQKIQNLRICSPWAIITGFHRERVLFRAANHRNIVRFFPTETNQELQLNDLSYKNAAPPARAKAQSPATPYHITSLRVPLFEVDLGQAVYHGNYYHFFELGRTDLLRKIGYPYLKLVNRQVHLSIVESRCKYRKALRYDDAIEIHTGITSLNRRSLTFSQLIYRLAQDVPTCQTGDKPELELCTEARLNMLCVSFAGRVTPLPEDFRLVVEAFIDKQIEL